MTTTSSLTSQDLDVRFFREVKNELGSMPTQKIVYLVRTVLSHIRRSLASHQIAELINKMPALFQLVFVSNWKYDEKQISINHLDELVESIYEEDQRNKKYVFKSEIEALGAVIVVLNCLNKFFGLFCITTFPYPLMHELQQAVQEDAA